MSSMVYILVPGILMANVWIQDHCIDARGNCMLTYAHRRLHTDYCATFPGVRLLRISSVCGLSLALEAPSSDHNGLRIWLQI